MVSMVQENLFVGAFERNTSCRHLCCVGSALPL